VACDTGKARHHGITAPNSILVIPPGEEEAFLSPLPVQAIWGIGPKTAARLEQKGIHRVADLIALGEEGATRLLGNFGRDLLARARGQDDRPVYTGGHEAKSISHEVTYDRDISDLDELEGTLRWQSSDVARRLRRSGLSGSTVRIKIRWPDFTTHTRQLTIPGPTDLDNQIYEAARTLFHQIWKPGRKVRLLGVGVSGLEQSVHQPGLWDNTTDRERRLREALDKLRNRYGDKAVIPAKRLEKKSREG